MLSPSSPRSTGDGETIEFLGTMTSDDEFEIVTTNLLTAEGSVVLDDVGDLTCAITDTGTGEVYDLTVSTGGLEPGVGMRELSFQIGDAPRRDAALRSVGLSDRCAMARRRSPA